MREWIVTNGIGGYASLTYRNTNTRKFHGLLVASLDPPLNRWVFLSNVCDKIEIDNQIYNFKDFKPSFSFDYFPKFLYEINDVKIKKTVFMPKGENTTILKYKINCKKPVTLIHSPIVNSRHFYDVTSQRYLSFFHDDEDGCVYLRPRNIDKNLKITLKDCFYKQTNIWETFYYERDRERNESWIDNNIRVGDFYKQIKKNSQYFLVSTIEDEYKNPSKSFSEEVERKKQLLLQSGLPNNFEKLVFSSDNFIVRRGNGKSVIAGYHWFSDWGRDTLISLPGLALVTKRFDDAKKILAGFGKYCRKGLIPNVFGDRDSQISYNTVDASLWFIDRVYQYLKYTNDQEFLNVIWPVLESIITGYKEGTDFGIFMDNDYLISHDPGLTWMDVKIGNFYSTPRSGKAVEIQALWYNSLKIMSMFSDLIGKKNPYYDLSEEVKNSFNMQFDKLYDVIDTRDLTLRPNIVFLASLDYTMIDKNLQTKILGTVLDKLVTIFGLRTLSPDDPNYKGSYLGDYNKDIAYHNGTAWPWLLGQFIKAYLKLHNYNTYKRKYAYQHFLKPMFDVYGDSWDGSIHEIYDGNPVYAPRGCISQAWSVAEILRCWVEDIEYIRPEFEKKYLLNEISI